MKRALFVAAVSLLAACHGGASVVPSSESPAVSSGTFAVTRVYQPDWAGPVLFTPGLVPMKIPQHRFASVEGEWTIPKALPTINCSNRRETIDGSSLWIAIDGWAATYVAHQKVHGRWTTYRSSDILQAGTESD
ncbi:MAG TPA: hypothetical protein VGK84_07010, partial [Candidatus Tumulicola sp.]